MPQTKDHNGPRVPESFALKALVASAIAIGLLALAVLLWYSVQVILLIFAGILLSIILRGGGEWVKERTRLPLAVATIVVFLIIVLFLAAVISLLWGGLSDQLGQLIERLPQALDQLRQRVAQTKIGAVLLDKAPQINAAMSGRGDLLGSITGVVSGTLNAFVSFMVIIFTGLYLALSPHMYIGGVLHLVPHRRRERIAELMGAIGYTLKWWLIGQGIDMVIVGVATWIGLMIIGVPLAGVLALITALFNFIPNFGPLFGMVPAVLLALGDDPQKAIYVVILFLVIQSIEGYIIMPRIQNQAVDLPDALTIVTQVLMGILAGAVGLALAAPLAAVAMVAVKMLYVEDTLGDRVKTPADEDAAKEVREVKKVARETERDQK